MYFKLHETKRQQHRSHLLLQQNKLSWFWLQYEWIFYHTHGLHQGYGSAYRHKASAGRTHFLSCYWTVGDNSHCDFLLFVTVQPPDTILHSSQTQVGNDSVPRNSITTSEAGKLGCIQWKFVTLCHQRFFSRLDHSWGNVLNYLKLHTLSAQRRYLDVLFLKNFFRGSKYCPTCLEATDLYKPNCNVKDFSSFYVDFKRQNCPARCALATNTIDSGTDVFDGHLVLVNMIG